MFKKFILSFLKILVLIILCLGISFIFVYPMWKWSSSSPASYTIVILILLAAFLIYSIVKKICKKIFNKKKEKLTSDEKTI